MRTTITLDADVEKLLRDAIRKNDLSFKQVVNDAIRAGLRQATPRKIKFRQRTISLGPAQNFRWDKVMALAADLEDEEIVRKLAIGK